MRSDAFGCVRIRSDAFGIFGNTLKVFGADLYSFDHSERFRKFLEIFGRVWMHWDAFGCIRKFLEVFQKFSDKLFFFQIFRRVRIKIMAIF